SLTLPVLSSSLTESPASPRAAPSTARAYTLPLHDALPVSDEQRRDAAIGGLAAVDQRPVVHGRLRHDLTNHDLGRQRTAVDNRPARKSTRLNASHQINSCAGFCM